MLESTRRRGHQTLESASPRHRTGDALIYGKSLRFLLPLPGVTKATRLSQAFELHILLHHTDKCCACSTYSYILYHTSRDSPNCDKRRGAEILTGSNKSICTRYKSLSALATWLCCGLRTTDVSRPAAFRYSSNGRRILSVTRKIYKGWWFSFTVKIWYHRNSK